MKLKLQDFQNHLKIISLRNHDKIYDIKTLILSVKKFSELKIDLIEFNKKLIKLIEDKNKVKEICDRYKCTINNFPIILKTDPISRYFNFKPGSLVEITRKSETCAEYIHYRFVT